ncbi:MAG: hypothetical protein NC122_04945 [Faecalibacterium sp.]|nr:hypothetical protein [Ruminococcus sp.]MCM1391892.1 hypothetical protein [Ruminococcus sp.]MCM1485532.1 hypothetical protein [Faecalibacterium sp.]
MTTEKLIEQLRRCAGEENVPHCCECRFNVGSAKCIGDMMLATADRLENAAEKLSYYASLEEQGRLIELPCSINDTVYCEGPIKGRAIGIKPPDVEWIIENKSEFGKTVFLSREEAEQALKERNTHVQM